MRDYWTRVDALNTASARSIFFLGGGGVGTQAAAAADAAAADAACETHEAVASLRAAATGHSDELQVGVGPSSSVGPQVVLAPK